MTRSSPPRIAAIVTGLSCEKAVLHPQSKIGREVLDGDGRYHQGNHGGRHRRGRSPITEAAEDGSRGGDRIGAEQHPAKADDVEVSSRRPQRSEGTPRFAGWPPLSPPPLDRQADSMQSAPQDESPGGSVPETPDDHGEHEIAIGGRPPVAISAEGHVQVVAEETRKGHVPAAPEILERGGGIGAIEVLREPEAQQESQADGDVGVPREVGKDLDRIGIDARQEPPAR